MLLQNFQIYLPFFFCNYSGYTPNRPVQKRFPARQKAAIHGKISSERAAITQKELLKQRPDPALGIALTISSTRGTVIKELHGLGICG